MSFLQYLKDKRFFFIVYLVIMLFVSLVMIVSVNQVNVMSNILYINVVCFFIVTMYIIIGFYYRRSFHREFSAMVDSKHGDFISGVPRPQTAEQDLYVELLKKLHQEYAHRLQEQLNEKRNHQDFITSWIHEVKVPIAASRLLMENSEEKTVDFLVDKFEDELNKIDNYVEQALYYARIDSFSKDYFITEVPLDQIIKKSVKKYAKSFIDKAIRFQLDEDELFVHTDSKWLGFIVDQIMTNSLKYTDEGGEISAKFEEDRKEKRLLIQDTGIGVKPEDLHRVFEKGFTGSIGRNHAKSTGMGLYLAKQMALKLGHDLSIESEEGSYTKLTVHFPKIRSYYHKS